MGKKKWKREDITPEVLRQLLHLDPETGKLYWKERGPEWFSCKNYTPDRMAKTWNKAWANKPVKITLGGNKKSVENCELFGIKLTVNRVVLAIKNGSYPNGLAVKDSNGIIKDMPRSTFKHRTSKVSSDYFRGVTYSKILKKYVAVIQINGTLNHIGAFLTPVEAARAYDKEAFAEYGEHAKLNFPEEYGLDKPDDDGPPEGYFDE